MREKLNNNSQDQSELQSAPEISKDLRSQNQEELSEEERQQLKIAKIELENIIGDATVEQRRDKLVSAFKPFFDAGIADPKLILPEIENCCSAKSRDNFIERAEGLIKLYLLARRKDTKGVERIASLAEKGRTVINEVLDYEYSPDGKIVKIHIWPKDREKVRTAKEIKELIFSGFEELANIVESNQKIEDIEAYSHLVKKHPKLLEKLGFKLGEEYITQQGESGQGSSISRQEFLERYRKKAEE